MMSILLFYFIASLCTFGLFGADKALARSGQWRISERTLHLFELAGGWPGALLGASYFAHKRRKSSYMLILYGTSALHLLFWGVNWAT
ncbi:MAG: DUF1294 domain-containing protein [Myxococcota bacterium]|nr:DUF1294 domain-containing protein [Myxococcota bacterium]